MFPLKVYVPFAFLNHYILFFTIQLFLGVERPILSFYSLFGVATILGFMLIMRIFDELKDTEIDSKLFAQRPFPRGAVKKSDLLTLLFITLTIVIIINSLRDYTLPFFLICLGYGFLTYKWFFMKEVISKNLILALATHNPITYLINIYVVSTAMVQTTIFHWNSIIFLSAFIFYLPVLGWELSRKIKAKGAENEYVTYSSIFGYKRASLLSLLVHLGFSAGMIYLGVLLNFYWVHFTLQLVVIAYLITIYLLFLVNPTQENNRLKKASEFQSAIATLIYLVFLIHHSEINFLWF